MNKEFGKKAKKACGAQLLLCAAGLYAPYILSVGFWRNFIVVKGSLRIEIRRGMPAFVAT